VSDILKTTRDALDVFGEKLIVGNHDSITLLGAQAQARLRDYSKSVSRIFLNGNDELELAISEVICEIEKFEIQTSQKSNLFLGFRRRRKELAKEYNRLLEYIERVSLFFQMQQAKLIKENKLLERLSDSVDLSLDSIQQCIVAGEKILYDRASTCTHSEATPVPLLVDSSTYDDTWYSRLERRLDDLRVSHTAALQSQAGIRILYNNNLVLMDRITSAMSNTFPIWQSQMILILGIEKMDGLLENQEKVFQVTSSHQQMDVERIIELTDNLKSVLKETASLEEKDSHIRSDFQAASLDRKRMDL
jgi:uncharacterized protein YaaN involved in tellurite resistance